MVCWLPMYCESSGGEVEVVMEGYLFTIHHSSERHDNQVIRVKYIPHISHKTKQCKYCRLQYIFISTENTIELLIKTYNNQISYAKKT